MNPKPKLPLCNAHTDFKTFANAGRKQQKDKDE
jgi:hypothetical protein